MAFLKPTIKKQPTSRQNSFCLLHVSPLAQRPLRSPYTYEMMMSLFLDFVEASSDCPDLKVGNTALLYTVNKDMKDIISR